MSSVFRRGGRRSVWATKHSSSRVNVMLYCLTATWAEEICGSRSAVTCVWATVLKLVYDHNPHMFCMIWNGITYKLLSSCLLTFTNFLLHLSVPSLIVNIILNDSPLSSKLTYLIAGVNKSNTKLLLKLSFPPVLRVLLVPRDSPHESCHREHSPRKLSLFTFSFVQLVPSTCCGNEAGNSSHQCFTWFVLWHKPIRSLMWQ